MKLVQGRFRIHGEEVEVLPPGYEVVLGCQTIALSSTIRVEVPATALNEHKAQIEDSFNLSVFRHRPPTRRLVLHTPLAIQAEEPSLTTGLNRLIDPAQELGLPPPDLPALRALARAADASSGTCTVTLGQDERGWTIWSMDEGDCADAHYGVAIDIGTTTVAALLVDIAQGKVIRKASMYNQQIQRADDVAARISYGGTPERLEELRRLVVDDTINPLIKTLCQEEGLSPDVIIHGVVSGNTVMTHLFYGLSPEGIGRIPFHPVTRFPPSCLGSEAGLVMHPRGRVEATPAIAGYVGGDIVSDLRVGHMEKQPDLTLLIDIGTNGEMVLKTKGTYLACATAAGPAFEGAGILHGRRAADGAIEKVTTDPSSGALNLQVIGGGRPSGICGSAIVDFMAEGLRMGWINEMGRWVVDRLPPGLSLMENKTLCGPGRAFPLVDAEHSATGKPITISEADVAQIMKAKAALYSGAKVLLRRAGVVPSDLHRLVLAGGFARHLDLRNAITIGLLPELPLDRIEVVGNGSLAGAFLALVDQGAMEEFRGWADVPKIVELNLDPDFESDFVDALALPHFDPDEFVMTRNEIARCSAAASNRPS